MAFLIYLLIVVWISLLVMGAGLGLVVALRHNKLWRFMTVKYHSIEQQMPAFIRMHGVYIINSDPKLFRSSLKRQFFFEAFSKRKTETYYQYLYRTDLTKKIKDHNVQNDIRFLLKWSSIKDIFLGIMWLILLLGFVSFLIYAIIGLSFF